MNIILSSDELQKRLLDILPNSKKVIIISAYISEKALKWLSSLIPAGCEITFVARLSLSDLKMGSSDLKAVKLILDNHWNIYRLSELHAKIYLIDDSYLFIGSANCTSNGLKLYGKGNIEGTVEINVSESAINFIQTIINKSSAIDFSLLEKMENFLSNNNLIKNDSTDWEQIFEFNNSLWIADCLWTIPENLLSDTHDMELLCIGSSTSLEDISKAFLNTKIFQWFYHALNKTENKELYYGALTVLLHSALCDDPVPYRKNIKELLSIFLEYCDNFASHLIKIDKPNYSQRISIK